jgi:hypothetical protein
MFEQDLDPPLDEWVAIGPPISELEDIEVRLTELERAAGAEGNKA